ALNKAERITAKNITLPVLSCILLEAENSTLIIKSTNLDLGIEISIPVKVIKPGKVAVSGSILNNFINGISNDSNISIEEVSGNIKIKTKHSEALIKAIPTDDFPNIPKINNGKKFTFNAPNLVKGFKSVMYSSSSSTIRPVLSSILISSEEENVVFVATDSFRLSEKRVGVKKHKDFNQILIPFKNVTEIIRTIEDISEDLEVSLNENQISFTYNDLYITSRVIDGVFPDYKQIIPKDVKTEVTLLKQDLVNSLRISNIFSDKFCQVVFNVIPKEKKIRITTKNNDIGENINSIDAVIKGDSLIISFNYKYIMDCFQSIDTDSITLYFSDISKPMVIKSTGDKSFMYLVMPMNK
ncbi:MAG: DNA polymerase III subunit beta, partial [Minisyncoccia bacterium]